MLPDRIRQTATEVHGGMAGDEAGRFDFHPREERPDRLHRHAVLQGHTHQARETVVQRDRFRRAVLPAHAHEQFQWRTGIVRAQVQGAAIPHPHLLGEGFPASWEHLTSRHFTAPSIRERWRHVCYR
jgi:hypothetical protein